MRHRFLLTYLYSLLGVSLSLLIAAPDTARAAPNGGSSDPTQMPEESDYRQTPYTEYGEFDEQGEENETTKFFQYGRFFGISAGIGLHNVTGNRGNLWRGGFPYLDFRVHYWFDFQLAVDFGFNTAAHNYILNNGDVYSVGMTRYGLGLKYYFDTKNLSAAITAAHPYVAGAIGLYGKTESNLTAGSAADADTSNLGVSLGGGLEFAIKHKKTYFTLEGRTHIVNFKDTQKPPQGAEPLPDLSGLFFSMTANLMFTW